MLWQKVFFANLQKQVLRLMSEGAESDKSAMVLLWGCGGTFYAFCNALYYATHKSMTRNPYKTIHFI